MLNYTKDGRAACLKYVADYIRENYPTGEETESKRLGITVKELRAKILKDKLNKVAVKSRISLMWRNVLQDRLRLNDNELVKALNTVLELVEKSLEEGKTVRIRGLGDFKVKTTNYVEMSLSKPVFIPDPEWMREINKQPVSTRLKRKYKTRLTREPEVEEFKSNYSGPKDSSM